MPWLKKPKTVTVYFWLRMHANHFPTEWCGLSLLPGELCASQERIECETGFTRAEVRTALDHLKASGCVVVKTYKLQPANQPANQPTASPAKAPTKCSVFCFTDKENWGSSEGGSTNLLTEGSTNDSTKEPATDKEQDTLKNEKKRTIASDPSLSLVKENENEVDELIAYGFSDNPYIRQQLRVLIENRGLERVREAVQTAADSNKYEKIPLKFLQGILDKSNDPWAHLEWA